MTVRWRSVVLNDTGLLILLATAKLIFHIFTNGQYGFHRDELATVDDARFLAWGYVAYPPLTPFIAHISFALFGPSLGALRAFAALSQSIAMVLAGLTARELGGRRGAQLITALAVAIAPVSLAVSTLFQYVAFDYMWWVLIAYLVVRLLKSDNPRWWVPIGAVIGLAMLTKYTVVFLLAGLIVGVLLTPARRYLRSPWLWAGVALSLLIFLPNLIWQVQNRFISLEFLTSIHARDVAEGRADEFILDQFRLSSNPFALPLWVAGLWFYLFSSSGKRYRMLGWMAVVTFALFVVTRGRGYYTGPLYPMLFAGGAVWWQGWLSRQSAARARIVQGVYLALLAVGTVVVFSLGPYAPIGSGWWNFSSGIFTELTEEVGWPELVQTIAGVYHSLPAGEQAQAGIFADNYGEAGAIDLYGGSYGLPQAISGVNSFWQRGYGDPPPQTLVVVGLNGSTVEQLWEACELAGHVTNAYGVRNEETIYHPDIFICRRPRLPWPELWARLQSFG